MTAQETALLEKIKQLPPERVAQVEDFVDFLRLKEERQLVEAAMKLSEPAFARVWNNPEDDVYDQL